ncbi:site-specific integrase [Alteromonas sediminis]|uniref:Site-specific integrase n=1 Tax=Alteromonas sediminis TaxID=2259342 RepID=A0A3N5ZBP0_9ALTE|nr:tyrosine-type recombinase/integrase [Alteromonas sediminis]RPJ68794.1 site-specific integrase [Alteromonas sediminis]
MAVRAWSVDEAKNKVQSVEGISIHGKSFRMSFVYLGQRRLEVLKNMPLTRSNLKWAINKRSSVLHRIETGTFDYIAEFPNSKTALKLLEEKKLSGKVPFNTYMEKTLALSKNDTSDKTFYNFNNRCENYVIPYFNNRCLKTITKSQILEWIASELDHLTNKTIGEVLTPLRKVFCLAYDDGLLDSNPMAFIKNPPKDSKDNADPFTREEIEKIANVVTNRELEKQAFILACWTGLRPSELLALSMDDIDLIKGTIKVNRVIVEGDFKATKTDGSERTIELLVQALEALKKVVNLASDVKETSVDVIQRDNRRVIKEQHKFIIISSKSGRYWSGNEAFSKMIMKPLCESAGVRYRPIGQARHTYGSQLITANQPLSWIAKQMGHKSIKMLEKHYGRWMDDESPDMAKQASQALMI